MQPLPENALTRSEFKFRDWLHEVDLSRVPLEDLFRSKYWMPLNSTLVQNDRIRVCSYDGNLDVPLYVACKAFDRITVARFPRITAAAREAEVRAGNVCAKPLALTPSTGSVTAFTPPVIRLTRQAPILIEQRFAIRNVCLDLDEEATLNARGSSDDIKLEDLFKPALWRYWVDPDPKKGLKPRDVVRVIKGDGDLLDVMLTVRSVE